MRKKLTLVSFHWKGRTYSAFVLLPEDDITLTDEELFAIIGTKPTRGSTFTPGG